MDEQKDDRTDLEVRLERLEAKIDAVAKALDILLISAEEIDRLKEALRLVKMGCGRD